MELTGVHCIRTIVNLFASISLSKGMILFIDEFYIKRVIKNLCCLFQQESEKLLSEKVAEAVDQRDEMWNSKMAAQEEANNEMLIAKV